MIKHSQKGMTIIEVVMSLAILMIIMVSVSGLVGTVTKSKQFTHDKQGATLLGQEIIEQMQLIDSLTKNIDLKYYVPLTGLNDLVNTDQDVLTGTYTGDVKDYQVTLELRKSEQSSEVARGDVVQDETEESVQLILETKDDHVKVTHGSYSFELTNGTPLKLEYKNNEFKVNESQIPIPSTSAEITLNFTDKYVNDEELTIEIINQSNPQQDLVVRMVKHINSKGATKYHHQGSVRIIQTTTGVKPLGDLYNFTLEIKKHEKLLFEAHGNKNFSHE